jgi:hypothetical protein
VKTYSDLRTEAVERSVVVGTSCYAPAEDGGCSTAFPCEPRASTRESSPSRTVQAGTTRCCEERDERAYHRKRPRPHPFCEGGFKRVILLTLDVAAHAPRGPSGSVVAGGVHISLSLLPDTTRHRHLRRVARHAVELVPRRRWFPKFDGCRISPPPLPS